VTATIPVGGQSAEIAVSPNGSTVYITYGTVTYDTTTRHMTQTTAAHPATTRDPGGRATTPTPIAPTAGAAAGHDPFLGCENSARGQ